ncbi:hypothetical protein BFJ72_g7408 [Fusarium proliferatum]|uniref:Uncharacterized protein n=1 Tax=Gibberella intermedia TaxID=948311 RepID=A0A420T8W0_GIBIN|nr:hypothetical protein BFJ72_g7408 [Fusarium proliferatum]
MHFLYILLFMLNLAQATPIALEESSLENLFKFAGDDSVPFVDGPPFLDLDIGNTETQKKHEKRSGPPYNLTYALMKVTFERRTGDAWDFKKPGWIFVFPGMFNGQGDPRGANRYDIAVMQGASAPLGIIGSTNGDLWYTSNSYFIPLVRGEGPTNVRRTYTKFAQTTFDTFDIITTRNDQLARQNYGAIFNSKGIAAQPTKGRIILYPNPNFTGVVDFSSGSITYKANITGKLFWRGTMLV